MSEDHSEEGHDEEVPHPRHVEHEEGGHGEPWLVSYADMMTLLFGFFVILYSLEAAKNQDQDAMVRIRKEVSHYFGGNYVNPLTEVRDKMHEKLKSMGVLADVQQRLTPEGLEINFQSQVLFSIGQAELTASAREGMGALITAVRLAKGDYSVRVEGYTDDTPISSAKYPSNWELSAARASTVVRMFEAEGFEPEKLSASGFGSTRATYPNHGPGGQSLLDNQARNRRVIVKIVPNLEQAPTARGLAGEAPANENPQDGSPRSR